MVAHLIQNARKKAYFFLKYIFHGTIDKMKVLLASDKKAEKLLTFDPKNTLSYLTFRIGYSMPQTAVIMRL
ncbi:MAG: hypothetical protein CK426_06710 [Legionella sp.]|nr:MAG: hypothetical protein CK423_06680 [Legionella sp.]PJD98388.1 MAG: hypothetical protein CK426_06710 [Legionella sp.]